MDNLSNEQQSLQSLIHQQKLLVTVLDNGGVTCVFGSFLYSLFIRFISVRFNPYFKKALFNFVKKVQEAATSAFPY